jgi:hypothetical protein
MEKAEHIEIFVFLHRFSKGSSETGKTGLSIGCQPCRYGKSKCKSYNKK